MSLSKLQEVLLLRAEAKARLEEASQPGITLASFLILCAHGGWENINKQEFLGAKLIAAQLGPVILPSCLAYQREPPPFVATWELQQLALICGASWRQVFWTLVDLTKPSQTKEKANQELTENQKEGVDSFTTFR